MDVLLGKPHSAHTTWRIPWTQFFLSNGRSCRALIIQRWLDYALVLLVLSFFLSLYYEFFVLFSWWFLFTYSIWIFRSTLLVHISQLSGSRICWSSVESKLDILIYSFPLRYDCSRRKGCRRICIRCPHRLPWILDPRQPLWPCDHWATTIAKKLCQKHMNSKGGSSMITGPQWLTRIKYSRKPMGATDTNAPATFSTRAIIS
jgi:hypothetical protein